MPVHKVGYRGWDGPKTPQWNRWWIITETGFRIALKSAWVRRLLLACWIPLLYWGVMLFGIEQMLKQNFSQFSGAVAEAVGEDIEGIETAEIERAAVGNFLEQVDDADFYFPGLSTLEKAISNGDQEEIRHTIWSWALLIFFRYPQGTAILFLLGFVAPTLISQDVRSRAFLMYFSRPIGRIEYILGKFFVPVVFVSLVTLVPAIFLYMFAVSLSPDFSVVYATWDIPIRAVLAAMVVVIPTCSIALMLSSVTQESRFATFAWFAVWALGHAAWLAILITQAVRMNKPPVENEVLESELVNNWSVVSLYNNLANVQNWIFGFESFIDVWPSFFVLVAITAVSLVILYRGVSAPMNV